MVTGIVIPHETTVALQKVEFQNEYVNPNGYHEDGLIHYRRGA